MSKAGNTTATTGRVPPIAAPIAAPVAQSLVPEVCLLYYVYRHSGVERRRPSDRDGVVLFPLLYFLAGSIIGARIAFVVAHVAIRFAFDQCRATVVARALDRCLRGFMDRNHILPIHFDAQHPICGCTAGHARILSSTQEGHLCRV